MSHTPEYVMGAQGFADAWTMDNVSARMDRLDAAGIGHYDTALLYPVTDSGASERPLGKIWKPEFVIDTKILFRPGALSREHMEESIHRRTCYDQKSHLLEWIEIAIAQGYIVPTVYQGQYNIFCRQYEAELFPLLCKHGVKFVANSPLAGGFATGKLTFAKDAEQPRGTRFEQSEGNLMGYLFRMWYDKPVFHNAVRELAAGVERHEGVSSVAQAAVRWLLFHSRLQSTDMVAIGPSTLSQLEEYLAARQAGPLPEELARQIDGLCDPLREEAASFVELGWWSV
ncbi:Aldo/keto reductase [Aspergillus sclerotiicarbonarius CBS 121057]|uniref:Aldo/keto reductase n=1 Tax=Aspergillus sclerotiicarbonarius (strain CBS 121057 / IBT 28362) TaxID=1448318 RepID=A0A319EQN3_ASPSB|nr:Aldo/keto reductase [Aspergillus sclerotiicarbonarius CBS 121057]